MEQGLRTWFISSRILDNIIKTVFARKSRWRMGLHLMNYTAPCVWAIRTEYVACSREFSSRLKTSESGHDCKLLVALRACCECLFRLLTVPRKLAERVSSSASEGLLSATLPVFALTYRQNLVQNIHYICSQVKLRPGRDSGGVKVNLTSWQVSIWLEFT